MTGVAVLAAAPEAAVLDVALLRWLPKEEAVVAGVLLDGGPMAEMTREGVLGGALTSTLEEIVLAMVEGVAVTDGVVTLLGDGAAGDAEARAGAG